jgi:hypothetical protein
MLVPFVLNFGTLFFFFIFPLPKCMSSYVDFLVLTCTLISDHCGTNELIVASLIQPMLFPVLLAGAK